MHAGGGGSFVRMQGANKVISKESLSSHVERARGFSSIIKANERKRRDVDKAKEEVE